MLDKYPLIIDHFKGIRVTDVDSAYESKNADVVPLDYGPEFNNLHFLKSGGMKTRDGFGLLLSAAGISITGDIVSFWQIKVMNGIPQVNRWLILTWDGTSGRMYDTQVASPATNPILGPVQGMKYAFVINAFNRIYISPWSDWGFPLIDTTSTINTTNPQGSFDLKVNCILVYNGLYNVRFAGMIIPSGPGTLAAATGAVGGFVTAGLHLIDVAFETDTGYISRPAGFGVQVVQYTAPGAREINITNAPLGPAPETKYRHLLMTKVVAGTYDGQGFLTHEPFFAGIIPDNTSTTGNINIPDSGLVDSAAYLLDRGTGTGIKACVTMSVYNNRMMYNGLRYIITAGNIIGPENNSSMLISPPGLPEDVTVNNTGPASSKLYVGQSFTGKILTGAELRGAYYVFKEDSIFAIQDNPDLDPAEWAVILVDAGLGAYPLGIASVTDNPGGLVLDNLIVGGPSGIHRFTGTFDPIPISLGWWDEFSPSDLKFIQIFADPARKLIFAIFNDPLSPGRFFFCGNYFEGFDANRIKWSKYVLPTARGNWNGKIPWLALVATDTSPYPTPVIGYKGASDSLITLETETPNKAKDLTVNADIDWSWITGFTPSEKGDLLNFTGVRLRAIVEDLAMSIACSGLDSDEFTNILESMETAQNPGKFITRVMSLIGEKARFKFSGSSKAIINKLVIFASDYGKDRAR